MRSSGSTAPGTKKPTGKRNSRNSTKSEIPSKKASKPFTPSGSPTFKESKLEREFAHQLNLAGIPFLQEIVPIPGRKFRFDFAFAHRGTLLLVEVQGGIFQRGGHSTGIGITRDAEKLNLAVLSGHPVFHVTAEHIRTGQALRWVQEFLSK